MSEWIIIVICLSGVSLALFSLVAWSLYNGISPMPTSAKAKRCLMLALPPQINGTIYDLGSGWGSLIFPLAEHYPACQVIGYETSPLPFFVSKIRLMLKKEARINILRKNFFHTSLADADLIVCYLYPGAMTQLKEKFSKELKKGTWVVSNTFSIPGQPLEQVIEIGDLYHSKIYLYRF